ncbi:hypothetical protein ASF13_02825 [Erwinia sp. Leaf53]|nr:hypothetical protein ASF13_02825 [Erwinia sp. Leaf53]
MLTVSRPWIHRSLKKIRIPALSVKHRHMTAGIAPRIRLNDHDIPRDKVHAWLNFDETCLLQRAAIVFSIRVMFQPYPSGFYSTPGIFSTSIVRSATRV